MARTKQTARKQEKTEKERKLKKVSTGRVTKTTTTINNTRKNKKKAAMKKTEKKKKKKHYFITATMSKPLGMVNSVGISSTAMMHGTVTFTGTELNQENIKDCLGQIAEGARNRTSLSTLGQVVSVAFVEIPEAVNEQYNGIEKWDGIRIPYQEPNSTGNPICMLFPLPSVAAVTTTAAQGETMKKKKKK